MHPAERISHDDEGGPGRRAASLVLRVAVLVHMAGWAFALHTRAGSALGGVALMEWGVPHSTISFHERLWSMVLLALATVLLVKPLAVPAFLLAIAVLVDTAAAHRFGGAHFAEWSYYTKALRYGAPLALGILLLGGTRWSDVATDWLLRVAVAVVFASHGLMALYEHPVFIDLLIGSTRNLAGMRMTESTAVMLLKCIGVADLLVAALLLAGRWRVLLAWLCLWAFVTALSRVTTYGIMSFPEVLTRSTHFLAPVAIYFLSPAGRKGLPLLQAAWRPTAAPPADEQASASSREQKTASNEAVTRDAEVWLPE